jgi:hypothetical protein
MATINKRLTQLENRIRPDDNSVKIIYLTWDVDDELDTQDEVISLDEFYKRYPGEEPGGVRLSWEA